MEPTPVSTQALSTGTRIEEFIIVRVLGSGGFGITYLAQDTGLNRQVVIKENLPAQFAWRDPTSGTVRPHQTTGGAGDDFEWSMKNFLREAETLASLDHTGIVRVLRKFETNGTAYFVMPFVEGVAFDTLIEERKKEGGRFTEDEMRGLLDHMLQALGYLHDRGIYHRDIKPGNILISNDGVPALIDFGSARQRLSERSMTVVESAGYTPFEQLQSRGNVGPWSDLYALAGTLVKTITFETPPKANDRAFDDPWVPLAKRAKLCAIYSAEFLASIDRAMAVRIENRWNDAGEWLGALRGNATAAVTPVNAGQKRAPLQSGTARQQSPQPSDGAPTSNRPGKKTNRTQWVIAGCAVLVVGAWAMISAGGNPQARTALQQDAEQRTARAESEQPALVEQVKAKEAAVKQAAVQQRAAQAKAKGEAEVASALARLKEEALQRERDKATKVIKATRDEPFVNSLGMKFVPAGTPGELCCVWLTRVKDFTAFVDGTGHDAITDGPNGAPAYTLEKEGDGANWKQAGGTWKDPRFPSGHGQDGLHPVVCVSYLDAEAFCSWLTKRDADHLPDGWHYRLPTDGEWSAASGPFKFPWGETWPPGHTDGNYTGTETMIGSWQGFSDEFSKAGRTDGWARTSPVGSFTPSRYGLFDMGGNAWEWCASWYKASMNDAETLVAIPVLQNDGGGQMFRVLRGGAWRSDERVFLRSAYRDSIDPRKRNDNSGFRVVLVGGG